MTLLNPVWSDLLLLSLITSIASLILLGVAAICKRRNAPRKLQHMILDGSNVMHWRGGVPQIETVRLVVDELKKMGIVPGVVFDANAGYLLSNKYQGDRAFSQALGLPRDQIMVVPKGTPADPFILNAARDLEAKIVTNDRYRDWIGEYPEISKPGQLIQGQFNKTGELVLNLTRPE